MIVYIDNPYRDLNGTERRFNLKTTSISPTFNFEGEEKCVGSQDETLALDLAWLFAEGEVKEAKEVELAIESSILHSNSVRMPLGSPAAAASATSFTGNAVPFPPATLAPGATSSSSRSSISSINSSSSSMLPPALPSLTPAPACPLTSADKLSTNHSVIVGFDLEWAPSYQTGVSPGKVALMQLCTGRRTLVVRLHKCAQLPKALTALFQKPGLIFTGVNIASDFSKLFAESAACLRGPTTVCERLCRHLLAILESLWLARHGEEGAVVNRRLVTMACLNIDNAALAPPYNIIYCLFRVQLCLADEIYSPNLNLPKRKNK